MAAEIIAGILIGTILGTISGLIPGIHANTMAGMLVAAESGLLAILGAPAVGVALFSALVVHTFTDCVPSTFFGVPDADTAISVLPAHALCMQGRGEEAVRLSALGSAVSMAFVMPLFAIFMFFLPGLQGYIDWWLGIILIIIAGMLILSSESPEWSAAVFLLSGLLGVFAFRYAWLISHTSGVSSVLMPLLTGLFGISVLLRASGGKMPEQVRCGPSVAGKSLAWHAGLGTTAGAVVGWLPGLSNATGNALLSPLFRAGSEGKGYIIATSAANTANAFLGLAALIALGRMRNGVMVVLDTIGMPSPLLIIAGGVAAALCGFVITLVCGRGARFLGGVPVRAMSYAVIGVVTLLAFLLTGIFGMFILVCATMVGLVPSLVNVRRVTCMGAVMVPVILFSLNIL
ncbi:tripartite tricarboxylate transporter permease [Methanogenium organophilum]|uniref:Tripartite tricarboxylate transporter permease n=1 Tax=Methanogenium organophilum TaxID=2199 RepID=A0A9X9S6R6_METOG|nr:tripartite tricarboxylate transporter permease [Methanogenium organophilum]WAI01910.1 tripartite tricarboxylate transporter permease [Methanogenium organophilum]